MEYVGLAFAIAFGQVLAAVLLGLGNYFIRLYYWKKDAPKREAFLRELDRMRALDAYDPEDFEGGTIN